MARATIQKRKKGKNMPNNANMDIVVVMDSTEYVRERFPRATMPEALETIASLKRQSEGDGVERVIGILVNEEKENVFGPERPAIKIQKLPLKINWDI